MKPKNRTFCPDCGKPKMFFETENKAENFIRFNAKDIPHGDKLRSYYCSACCGWHISSHEYHGPDRTEILLNQYHKYLADRRAYFCRLKRQKPKPSPEEIELMEQIADMLCEKYMFKNKRELINFFNEHIPFTLAIKPYRHRIKIMCYQKLGLIGKRR